MGKPESRTLTGKIIHSLKDEQWKKQGERFGLGISLATAVMAALSLYRGHMERMEVLASVSAIMFSFALIAPSLLYPAAWLLESAFKALTTSLMYVLLILTFYLVFAPAGVALRLLRKDILDLKWDPEAETYWRPKKQRDPSHVERQF